jgi:thiamine-phosphate pyrophosphorylase
MTIPFPFGFYAILTDPVRGYEYCTKVLVDHEIAFVQLRMKDAPPESVLETARMMREITRGTATRLIINDDPHVAHMVEADGVHLGQDDMPYGKARRIVGEEAIVGLSTHSAHQMKNACAFGPDYVGVGPVFPTPTKEKPDPVIGIEGMKAMIGLATVPAVAIGGVNLKNLPMVLEAGARNFCMVRPLTQSAEPEKVVQNILKVYKEFVGRQQAADPKPDASISS